MKRLACLAVMLLVVLGLGTAALATQYVFQERFQVSWSRYLMPEFLWQREKYPSVRWAFDLVEPLVNHPDPRKRFVAAESALALDNPAIWSNLLVGPQLAGLPPLHADADNRIDVATAGELRAALDAARPGTVIQLQPGTYDFSGSSLLAGVPGEPGLPIVVRAAELGSVRLRFSLVEGFQVVAPFWVIENLVIEGTCRSDSRCEHAFHVVGAAEATVIRNNWVLNFNATVKVNGNNGLFPDNGLIEHNAFVNDRPRDTDNPVTMLDIVAASRWRVRSNLIAGFAKAGGDYTSYGAFFKGAGENNIFEQNLVRCEWGHTGGARVGFSFGGGGTARPNCRDSQCTVEHRGGIARSNVIMNCPNDVGIYLNKSADTTIHNNALINTRGIDVKDSSSYADIMNNIVDGRILVRDSATVSRARNIVSDLKAAVLAKVSAGLYANAEQGDLRISDLEALLGRGRPVDSAGLDLCDQPYDGFAPDIGPIQYRLNLACTPVLQ
jgi:hypothetical protein